MRFATIACEFGASGTLSGSGVFHRPVAENPLSGVGLTASACAAAADPGARAIVLVQARRISDSCGYAVPFMDYQGERRLLAEYFGRRDEEFHVDYVARKNTTSIDGLPAVPVETLRGQLESEQV